MHTFRCKQRKHLLALVLHLLPLAALGQEQGAIQLQIVAEEIPAGPLYLSFFDASDSRGWHAEPVFQQQLVLQAGRQEYALEGLQAGDYAVRAFVDLNANGMLDLNAKRRPLEPVGFSVANPGQKPSLRFRAAKIHLGFDKVLYLALLLKDQHSAKEARPDSTSSLSE